ncbi:MAG: DNA primase [Armatimonadota bacterium]
MSPMNNTRHRYDVEVVKERTDLLALIGQHVALKKRGGRYTGLCPFHQEKTPSFSVDPTKGFWHCFGCGKGGDAINFVMTLEHLEFSEAVERLAERAGIRPSLEDAEAPRRREERDFLFEANAAAAAAFRVALRGKAGAAARAYLEGRGLTGEDWERFGLGYAPPGWDSLVTHLQQRGFKLEILAKAGLALARSTGEGYIDRFRNRLMIPIHDRQGRVVGFGGRALADKDQPKYLNTADTPVFHKGQTLYALHLAADSIARRGRVIVTEGYFDAIACHLAGFTEAVAALGTGLGEYAQILHRLNAKIYLVYDGDSAGINAALRSQAAFREVGADVRIALLPAGHDPDTFLREQGAEGFERLLNEALSPVEFELERLIAQHPATDTESRVRLFRAAARVLQPLSQLERSEYALRLIDRWGGGTHGDAAELQKGILSEVAALDRAGRGKSASTRDAVIPPLDEQERDEVTPADIEVPLEREIMTAIVQNPDCARRAVAQVPADAFTHRGYRTIFIELQRAAEGGQAPDVRHLLIEDDRLAALIASLAVREALPEELFPFEKNLDRLLDEYEARQVKPREISMDEHEALEAYRAKHIERSRRAAHREGLT